MLVSIRLRNGPPTQLSTPSHHHFTEPYPLSLESQLFVPNFLGALNFFLIKSFLSKIFVDQHFFDLNFLDQIFLDPNFFGSKKKLVTQIILTYILNYGHDNLGQL